MAQRTRRTHEETSSDGTTDGNHLQMPGLHLLLEERVVILLELGWDVTVSDKTTVCVCQYSPIERVAAATHRVVPGARLKLSKLRPARVRALSLLGS